MTERVEATGETLPGGTAPAGQTPARAGPAGAAARGSGPAGAVAVGRALAARRSVQHLLALLVYAGLSLAMFGPWILDRMTTWLLSASTQDGSIFVWMFRWWPYAIGHLISPFYTTAAWAPGGINLGWVTSVPAPAAVMSPLTAAFGPFVSFNLVELAAPALAAWTAYLLCRHLVGTFVPALAGGFFFGFSPYLIDEFGQGHPNLSLVFLVPLAAYLVVRLLDGSLPARWVIPLLGVVLAAQLYISTETFATLTFMGLLFALIGLAAGPLWRRRLRAAAVPLAASYAVAAVLGIPLIYGVFARPRPYKPVQFATIGHGAHSPGDFLRYLIPGRFTVLWDGSHWNTYGNPWYLGIPLIVLLIVFVAADARRRGTRLLAAGLLVTLAFSIGDRLTVFGAHIMPWRLASALPLLSHAQPGRLVVYAFLLIAVIAARWLARRRLPAVRWALAASAALVILPNFHAGVWASRIPVPDFFTRGTYQRYLRPGEIVWIVNPHNDRQMIWQAQTGLSFRLAGGFFGVTPPGLPHPGMQARLGTGSIIGASVPDIRNFLTSHRVSAVLVSEQPPRSKALPKLARATGVAGVRSGQIVIFQLLTRPRPARLPSGA
ncbi:MAG TPA: hypothetical protein VKD66_04775 [Streptosporangiaceae bacterium]|nr:hypothetical protein [Streptosporangiaceae bacterium]